MIYFGSFFAGIINGLFASGAGQILVFVLVFILKEETHKARATSVLCIGLVTIFTIFRYLKDIKIDIREIIIVGIVGLLFGPVGSKIMKKIPSGYLNLISGLLITGLAIYSLIRS